MSELTWTVFLVQGTSGSYEDRSQWPVEAFTTRKAADSRAAALNEAAREYATKKREHDNNGPPIDDENYDEQKWDRHTKKAKRLLRAARLEAREPLLDDDSSYWVNKISLRGEAAL